MRSKIVLTAFAGNAAVQAMHGGATGKHIATLVAVAAIWIAAGWGARLWLKAREAKNRAPEDVISE